MRPYVTGTSSTFDTAVAFGRRQNAISAPLAVIGVSFWSLGAAGLEFMQAALITAVGFGPSLAMARRSLDLSSRLGE